MDARLQTPFSMGIFGCRNSGKYVFTKKLLISDLIDVPFKKVLWIYKTMGRQANTAIVIDDYFVEAANNNQVLALFSRGRHLSITIILLPRICFTEESMHEI